MKILQSFKSKSLARQYLLALAERKIEPSASFNEETKSVEISYPIFEKSEDLSRSVSIKEIYEIIEKVLEEIKWSNDWISKRIDAAEAMFFKHKEGHLPPILGSGKMKNALDILGISDDYEVTKRTVWP